METGNRRLIRPSFSDAKMSEAKMSEVKTIEPKAEAREPRPSKGPPVKKVAPPDQTNAENFYYIKQMQSKTRRRF